MSQDQVRRPFIAGNWKMHKTVRETEAFIDELKKRIPEHPPVDVALAPPFIALEAAMRATEGTMIGVAAQNVFWEEKGAFTGEISPGMLTSLGVTMAIIGHSERRQYFGETDQTVNRRLRAALAANLLPILCIGETLEEREAERVNEVLERQIREGLQGVDAQLANRVVVAYEPVWAIGTGRTATPEIAQETHAFIRQTLASMYNKMLANQVRILYGGSVKPGNTADLMAQPDIDGALVGGASLDADVFAEIIRLGGK